MTSVLFSKEDKMTKSWELLLNTKLGWSQFYKACGLESLYLFWHVSILLCFQSIFTKKIMFLWNFKEILGPLLVSLNHDSLNKCIFFLSSTFLLILTHCTPLQDDTTWVLLQKRRYPFYCIKWTPWKSLILVFCKIGKHCWSYKILKMSEG